MPPMKLQDVERFLEKVQEDANGCWNWTKACSRDGYGRFKVSGKCVQTHRLSYSHWVGPIPQGFEVDHKCVNPHCCNPAHLEAVPKLVNLERKKLHRTPELLAAELAMAC
jgi:hypothetical protein